MFSVFKSFQILNFLFSFLFKIKFFFLAFFFSFWPSEVEKENVYWGHILCECKNVFHHFLSHISQPYLSSPRALDAYSISLSFHFFVGQRNYHHQKLNNADLQSFLSCKALRIQSLLKTFNKILVRFDKLYDCFR